MKFLFGVNVTFPVASSTVYVPTSFPSFIAGALAPSTLPVFGSTKTIGFSLDGVTAPSLPSNFGFSTWTSPCTFVLVSSFDIGTTVGIYRPSMVPVWSLTIVSFALTGVHPVSFPLSSVRRIVIPLPVPTNPSSGINVTVTSFPAPVTLYFPSPATT